MKNKIAIIVPYFGKFPVWFDLFLYSCSKNENVDFLFFTDCIIPNVRYANTIFFQVTFEEYCARVSNALGIDFSPKNPYKLCDLKPFYGIIHKDELEDYDFWGFGDVDLIYGDLELVLSEHRLAYFDLITTHDDRVAGHFTVIRKSSKFTHLCLKIRDYKSKLEAPTHLALDEEDWTCLVFPQLPMLERIYRHIVKPFGIWHKKYFKWVNPLFCNRLTKVSFIEYFTTEIPKETETWTYFVGEGTLKKFPQGRDLPYLHFLFFKKTQYLKTDNYWKENFYKVPRIKDVAENHQNVCVTAQGISVCDE